LSHSTPRLIPEKQFLKLPRVLFFSFQDGTFQESNAVDVEQQNRIIELAFQWQQKNEWTAAFNADENFRHYRVQASKRHAVIGSILDRELPPGQLDLFQNPANRYDELSDFYHGQVDDAHQGFCELNNLLRSHAPTLAEYVPTVNFFEPAAADYTPQIRDLKKLEGNMPESL
jgi:hypothetical protein